MTASSPTADALRLMGRSRSFERSRRHAIQRTDDYGHPLAAAFDRAASHALGRAIRVLMDAVDPDPYSWPPGDPLVPPVRAEALARQAEVGALLYDVAADHRRAGVDVAFPADVAPFQIPVTA